MTTTSPNTVRMMRDAMGLTQRELAERAGVSRYWLSRAERGLAPLHVAKVVCASGCTQPQVTENFERIIDATFARAGKGRAK